MRGGIMRRLPLDIDLYDVETLKLLSIANNKIGELKGVLNQLPNPDILLHAVSLGEAKDSSEIENIITTYDDLYNEMINPVHQSAPAKEVLNYHKAIVKGFEAIKKNDLINIRLIKEVQSIIEENKGGIRKLPGTVVKNTVTGEIVHTPPQSKNEILDYLSNLELYINTNDDYDALVNMAVIHYQFESIHPFYDGNGRTSRVLNVLYLVMKNKISYPVLYLSRYIVRNKQEYYRLLKESEKDTEKIRDFVRYLLVGIEETATFTLNFISRIIESMNTFSQEMKTELPKQYSVELVDYLFSHFYTKIEFFRNEFSLTRQTASNRLKELEEYGFLESRQVGRETIYFNTALTEIMKIW